MQSQVSQAPAAVVNFEERFDLGPAFKTEFGESEIGRFKLKVDPLSYSDRRMSFSLRAPGLGLLMSPTAYIETSWDIEIPGKMSFASQMGPMAQLL